MSNRISLPPSLCIDLKKNRIRIHRHTLQLLGNPDYIQLLVNPGAGMIAIMRSTGNDHLAHKIILNPSECCELYSSYLIENLMTVNSGLMYNQSYRLYGELDSKACIAMFPMNDLHQLSEEELCEN